MKLPHRWQGPRKSSRCALAAMDFGGCPPYSTGYGASTYRLMGLETLKSAMRCSRSAHLAQGMEGEPLLNSFETPQKSSG